MLKNLFSRLVRKNEPQVITEEGKTRQKTVALIAAGDFCSSRSGILALRCLRRFHFSKWSVRFFRCCINACGRSDVSGGNRQLLIDPARPCFTWNWLAFLYICRGSTDHRHFAASGRINNCSSLYCSTGDNHNRLGDSQVFSTSGNHIHCNYLHFMPGD